MIVSVSLEEDEDRKAPRLAAAAPATMRPFRARPESVRIVNISTDGCGFESPLPFRPGMTVLLYLPDLDPLAATVKWWQDGRGGVAFARKLHPSVIDRLGESLAEGA